MALRDILVYLDSSERAATWLRLACELARRHGAHLTGLLISPPLLPPPLPMGAVGYIDPAEFDGMLERLREQQLSEARRAEERFWERLQRDAVAGEFRVAEGSIAGIAGLHARYSDLAIVGQADPDASEPNGQEIVEEILFSCGRPVLVVPYSGRFDSVGETVLVGWNGTPESARAMNDAIPLLEQARSVTVLAINACRGISGDGELPARDIALHLARHGIEVTAAHTVAEEISVGDTLLNYASDIGADLLVVGGYGHSRVREIVLGGVTRSLLRATTVPLLMSH